MKVLNFYHLGKTIPEGAVYIGRAMPHMELKASKFANPFKLKDDEPRGSTIQRYKKSTRLIPVLSCAQNIMLP